MAELLETLRTATRALHERLDASALSAGITDGTLDPPGYRALIAWQYRAHASAERGLAEFAWPEAYGYRARLPILEEEARRLGLAHELPRLPLAPPTTLAQATGRAYVFEGSSLGGNMIVGHLQNNARLAALAPFAYYAFQREFGLGQWRRFTAFAKTHPWTAEELSEAATAAQEVFAVFGRP